METETFIVAPEGLFSPASMDDFENGDAYLPDSMKYAEGGLGDAYQKVANRLRDNGTLLKMRKKMASKKKVDNSVWKKYLPYCQRDIELYLKCLERFEEIRHGM